MFIKCYLIIGVVVATFIAIGYLTDNKTYTKTELFFGSIIDIIAWPFIILLNIIE